MTTEASSKAGQPLKPNGDKIDIVRDHIIRMIESGTLKAEERVPPARELARTTGVSFITVLNAISSLVSDGLLLSEPRRPAVVNRGWQDRPLADNLAGLFPYLGAHPQLEQLVQAGMGDHPIHHYRNFNRGLFEIVSTLHAQTHHDEYMDLSPFMSDDLGPESPFFVEPFSACRAEGKLFGIPLSFSPKVIFYNPRVLARAGCAAPQSGWTWDEFTELLRKLKASLPGERIFNWYPGTNLWMTPVFRAGGTLLVGNTEADVRIDSAATRKGLRLWREIGKILDMHPSLPEGHGAPRGEYHDWFASGKTALLLGSRSIVALFKDRGFDGWEAAPLPTIPGATNKVLQTTNILCIRRACHNPDVAARLISVMLGEPVQDCLARHKIGIPVRKASAFKSIDMTQLRETLFLHEIPKLTADYCLNTPELHALIVDGINMLWDDDRDIDAATKSLADAVRTFMAIRRHTRKSAADREDRL